MLRVLVHLGRPALRRLRPLVPATPPVLARGGPPVVIPVCQCCGVRPAWAPRPLCHICWGVCSLLQPCRVPTVLAAAQLARSRAHTQLCFLQEGGDA